MDDLKPILNEADYQRAMDEFARLWGAPDGTPEGDRLVLLSILIEKYEDEAFPMDVPDPVDAILFRMEQQGLTRKDLEPIIGTRARVAGILNRKRGLSIEMIRALHEKLTIPAEVLIRPVRLSA